MFGLLFLPGIQAIDMAITKTGIWALNTQGEIFFRYGIALDNPTGDYWKKIPGALTKISGNQSVKCKTQCAIKAFLCAVYS